MYILGFCLAFRSKDMHLQAACRQRRRQFEDGALSATKCDIGSLNYDCDFPFHCG
jgi:hypothetical protein